MSAALRFHRTAAIRSQLANRYAPATANKMLSALRGALKYRVVIERLEAMLGRRMEIIHIVGGGSHNRQLCQLTADATGRLVVAGPVEATALGNVVAQAMALGQFASLAEAREVVHNSSELVTYEPHPSARWDEVYTRFTRLLPV